MRSDHFSAERWRQGVALVRAYWREHKNFRRMVGTLCIVAGAAALLTPLMPGSWLILVGLEIFGFRILLWEKIKKKAVTWYRIFFVIGMTASLLAAVYPVRANHAWNSYHWARASTPFTVLLGDHVLSAWDSVLRSAAADWSVSAVLDTVVTAGGRTTPRSCRPTPGKVEVCSSKYGSTGWLGVASVWTNGDIITQATVKLNDTYFSRGTYNSTAWRNLVACQEIGHTLGLGHQDENFSNPSLGTCMDYTNDPTPNQHPNEHDYEELAEIYADLDTAPASLPAFSPSPLRDVVNDDPSQWGDAIRTSLRERSMLFQRDLGDNQKLFTFIVWIPE